MHSGRGNCPMLEVHSNDSPLGDVANFIYLGLPRAYQINTSLYAAQLVSVFKPTHFFLLDLGDFC